MPLHKAIIICRSWIGKTRTLTIDCQSDPEAQGRSRKYPGCYLYQQSSAGDERAHPEGICRTVGGRYGQPFESLAANEQTHCDRASINYHQRFMDRHIPQPLFPYPPVWYWKIPRWKGRRWNRNFSIFDEDANSLVKQIVKQLNLDDKKFEPRSVRYTISNAKNQGFSPRLWKGTTKLSWAGDCRSLRSLPKCPGSKQRPRFWWPDSRSSSAVQQNEQVLGYWYQNFHIL